MEVKVVVVSVAVAVAARHLQLGDRDARVRRLAQCGRLAAVRHLAVAELLRQARRLRLARLVRELRPIQLRLRVVLAAARRRLAPPRVALGASGVHQFPFEGAEVQRVVGGARHPLGVADLRRGWWRGGEGAVVEAEVEVEEDVVVVGPSPAAAALSRAAL